MHKVNFLYIKKSVMFEFEQTGDKYLNLPKISLKKQMESRSKHAKKNSILSVV